MIRQYRWHIGAAILLIMIIRDPSGTAHSFQTIGAWIVHVAGRVGDFFSALVS